MGMEIDFLAVGKDSSKSGDAIALRFGDLFGPRSGWGVVVVDGGHSTIGDEMAEHILEVYGTSQIDLMVSTHPDNDHINGLITLLERDDVTVSELWVHQPWKHDKQALFTSYIADRTKAEEKSFDAYIANAKKLYDLAVERGVAVEEPFAGMRRELPATPSTSQGPTRPSTPRSSETSAPSQRPESCHRSCGKSPTPLWRRRRRASRWSC